MLKSLIRAASNAFARHSAQHGDYTHQTQLSNGIDVASQRRFKDPMLRFEIRIKAGSIDDLEGRQGAAHFLEHVLYGENTAVQFIERHGYINAATASDYIIIEGEVENTPDNRDFMIDAIADILCGSVQETDFLKQREGILNEIGYCRDKAEHIHRESLDKTFAGNKGGCNVLGDTEQVEAITIEDLEAFKKTWFTGPNIDIAFTNISDHEKLCEALEKKLNGISAQTPPPHYIPQMQAGYFHQDFAANQLYFSFNFPVSAQPMERDPVVNTSTSYLREKVYRELKENKSIVYEVTVLDFSRYDRPGHITVRGNVRPESADRIVPALTAVLAEAARRIDPQSFESIKGRLQHSFDGKKWPLLTAHTASDMAYDVVHAGRVIPVLERERACAAVTPEQVREFINTILDRPPVIVVSGDDSNLHSYEDFTGMLAEKRQSIEPDIT